MKCMSSKSKTQAVRAYSNTCAVLKVGRVAIITRGRYAGKKVRLQFLELQRMANKESNKG